MTNEEHFIKPLDNLAGVNTGIKAEPIGVEISEPFDRSKIYMVLDEKGKMLRINITFGSISLIESMQRVMIAAES